MGTDRVTIPHSSSVFVRPRETPTELAATPGLDDGVAIDNDGALLEFETPVRLFVDVPEAGEIRREPMSTTILETGSRLRLKAVARRERPPAVVSIPDTPDAFRHALSRLSVKASTMGSERSRPDYRDTPPQFVRDSSLDLAELPTPETGIRIATRPSYDFLLPLAPLVYYLGATVEIATTPKLITAGHTHPLPARARPYERTIERLLKRFVVCDAMTRSAGPYPGAQAELAAIGDDLPFNPMSLYGDPMDARVARYLQADYDTLAPVIPQWDLKAHIGARPGRVELLPDLARDLAPISVTEQSTIQSEVSPGQVADVAPPDTAQRGRRSESHTSVITPTAPPSMTEIQAANADDEWTEAVGEQSQTAEPPTFLELPSKDAVDVAWGGDGVPINGSKGLRRHPNVRRPRAFPTSWSDVERSVDIGVICQLPTGRTIDSVAAVVERARAANQAYPLDVTVEYCADRERLADLLEREFDIVQFIGHIAEQGFEATDGYLALDDVDNIGIRTFILNGCTSIAHGERLLKQGATAGIVTVQDVIGVGAERAGVHLGRLLAHGYTFRGAYHLLERVSPYIRAYTLVGDGGVRVNQRGTVPSALSVDVVDDCFEVKPITLPTTAVGARFDAALGPSDRDMLAGRDAQPRSVSEDTLETLLAAAPARPVLTNGELRWAAALTPGESVLGTD
jgi:hypothetical protein